MHHGAEHVATQHKTYIFATSYNIIMSTNHQIIISIHEHPVKYFIYVNARKAFNFILMHARPVEITLPIYINASEAFIFNKQINSSCIGILMTWWFGK